MYSQTDICNMALDNFGGGRIVDITDDSEQARLFRSIYPNARQALLAKGCWNFAVGYEVLSKIYDPTVYHPVFPNIYVYPANTIKVVRVFSCGVDFSDRYIYPDFEVFSRGNYRYIGTCIDEAKAQVIYDITSTNLYSPEFVTCFSFLLSARVAEALTRNGQIVQEMEAKYQATLQDAMLTNARENEKKTQYPDRFLRFRNSVGVGYRRSDL